jgi:hypothetical protein
MKLRTKCLGWCGSALPLPPGVFYCPFCKVEKHRRENALGRVVLARFERPRLHDGRVVRKAVEK